MKTLFSPVSDPIRLKALFGPIGATSFSSGQTFQLTLEKSLINRNCTYNYVIPFSALENHVFLPFDPYLALVRPTSGQSGLKT